jgi:hypothetical protein
MPPVKAGRERRSVVGDDEVAGPQEVDQSGSPLVRDLPVTDDEQACAGGTLDGFARRNHDRAPSPA